MLFHDVLKRADGKCSRMHGNYEPSWGKMLPHLTGNSETFKKKYLFHGVLLLFGTNLLSFINSNKKTVWCCKWAIKTIPYPWYIAVHTGTIGKPHGCVEQLLLSDRVCLWGLISCDMKP